MTDYGTGPFNFTTGDTISEVRLDTLTSSISHLKEQNLQATNTDGGSHAAGEVVVLDGGASASVLQCTSVGQDGPIGVAYETVAASATGWYAVAGRVLVKVQGAVAVLDPLQTSATAGRAQSGSANAFATAITPNASGAGTVLAVLQPGTGGGGGGLAVAALTPPTNAGFTWTNQSTATSTDVAAGIRLVTPTTDGLRIRRQALAGSEWVATLGVSPIGARSTQYQHFGLCVLDTGGTTYQTFGPWFESGVWRFQTTNWSSATAVSASLNIEALGFYGSLFFLQVEHTASNRIYRLSQDGVNWITWVSTTLTDFLTPNAVGFFATASTSAKACDILAVHWENV